MTAAVMVMSLSERIIIGLGALVFIAIVVVVGLMDLLATEQDRQRKSVFYRYDIDRAMIIVFIALMCVAVASVGVWLMFFS